MKLFRFMSYEEFFKYMQGEVLINNRNHKDAHFKTESIGFCFFNYAHYKPEEMFHSVIGIVSPSICCIFETARKNIIKSHGRYSKGKSRNSVERISFIAEEYCTTQYSKETFILKEVAVPEWTNWDEWNWKELK